MTKHLKTLSILILCCSVFYAAYVEYFEVRVHQLSNLNTINLPLEVKQKFYLNDADQPLVLIQIDGRKINYYYPGKHFARLKSILDKLTKILTWQPNIIPKGDYLICIQDGIKMQYYAPVLAFSSTKELVANNQVILMPDHKALQGYSKLFTEIDLGVGEFAWQNKIPKIFWRGATTGGHECNTYDCSPRLKFIQQIMDAAFVDAAFTVAANNLKADFIKQIRQENAFKNPVTPKDSLAFKYLFDIDGNSCSFSRMAWILYSNSVLMKHQSDNIQWYYNKLQPYVNFLPINSDFSNLQQQFEWAESHAEEILAIRRNAHNLALEVFTGGNVDKAVINAFITYHNIVR